MAHPAGRTANSANAATRRLDGRRGLAARYVGLCLPVFAAWEVARLPRYTMWDLQGVRASLIAALHCTAGDAAYALLTLACASTAAAHVARPRSVVAVATMTLLLGLALTPVAEVVSTAVGLHRAPGKGGTVLEND
jgi:hypothetical protein